MNAIGTKHHLRSRDVVLAEYQAVVAYEEQARAEEFRNFLAGARTALAWVLGRSSRSPASGRLESATEDRMRREEQFCDNVIYSTDARPTLNPDFANGVEHALSWARGEEDLPPTPLELAPAAAAMACACR